jgi:hypothetical protein
MASSEDRLRAGRRHDALSAFAFSAQAKATGNVVRR